MFSLVRMVYFSQFWFNKIEQYIYIYIYIYISASQSISLNIDNTKSDTVSLELNIYTKQDICASRAPELILKNMCAITS